MPATYKIALEPVLTIAQVAHLQDVLQKAWDKADEKLQDITINGKKVERIDTSALQLLYSFAHELETLNIGLTWKSPSEALLTGASMLGISEKLGLSK